MATPRAPARGRGTTGGPEGGPGAHARLPRGGAPGPPGTPKPPGPRRAVIERIRPLVDGGRFPSKAAVGDLVTVEADAFCDGHDLLACDLRFQREGDTTWS